LGIATTFMPSYQVLQKAAMYGLNLVLAHEAPFYNHMDHVDWLAHDPVYLAKSAWLAQSGISVFRLHDYLHRCKPDSITEGLIRDLEWEMYVDKREITIELSRTIDLSPLTIPKMRLGEVVKHVKEKLNIPHIRVVGDPSMVCSRVGILPGYQGVGDLAIRYFQKADLDLIVTGEGPEWETPEYVRDAVAQGMNKALMVIGHEASEESGMRYLAKSLKVMYPTLPVEHIAVQKPLQFM